MKQKKIEKHSYIEVDVETFKDNIHYYLSQSTLENVRTILIKERYGEFVVMPKAKFSKEIFDAFMCGLDETLQNKGLCEIIKMDEEDK